MIELETHGPVTVLRMVRGKGNALSLDFVTAIAGALDQIEASPTRAVIITANGSTFGAGVDLNALVSGGPDYVRRFLPVAGAVFERVATFPKPLVAAVNGHAIAGGAIIMMACDIRLLARGSARIGLSEIQVGVQFPAWALEIARFATPPQHFSELICTGRTWQPEDALKRGLVDELIEPEKLLDRAREVAEEMAAFDPETFAATKQAVRRDMVAAARRAAADESDIIERWCDPKLHARIAEFMSRNVKRG